MLIQTFKEKELIMPIKSTVSNTPCCKKELSFPKLMKGTKTGSLLLFIDRNDGVVLVKGTGPYAGNVGAKGAASFSEYVDFKGSVCLENEKD